MFMVVKKRFEPVSPEAPFNEWNTDNIYFKFVKNWRRKIMYQAKCICSIYFYILYVLEWIILLTILQIYLTENNIQIETQAW